MFLLLYDIRLFWEASVNYDLYQYKEIVVKKLNWDKLYHDLTTKKKKTHFWWLIEATIIYYDADFLLTMTDLKCIWLQPSVHSNWFIRTIVSKTEMVLNLSTWRKIKMPWFFYEGHVASFSYKSNWVYIKLKSSVILVETSRYYKRSFILLIDFFREVRTIHYLCSGRSSDHQLIIRKLNTYVK